MFFLNVISISTPNGRVFRHFGENAFNAFLQIFRKDALRLCKLNVASHKACKRERPEAAQRRIT